MVWQLWSRNRHDVPQGVFSHATVLTLHDLSDVMPAKLVARLGVRDGIRNWLVTAA